jgi:hypothetical protein
MANLEDQLHDLLLYDVLKHDFAETNERFVIIEKYETHKKGARIGDTNLYDAVVFYKTEDNEVLIHRNNKQPAVISSRLKAWYKNGLLHREGGKPALIRMPMHIKDDTPTTIYAINGKNHRDFDEPAIIMEGDNPRKMWYEQGVLHRDKKPAIVTKNILYYVDQGYCHSVRFIWRNKFVTTLIENPIILISLLFLLFLWARFF